MKLNYKRSKYAADNSTAIMAFDKEGYPYGDVTVCLFDYGMIPPNENFIFVPTYKMSKDFYDSISTDLFEEVLYEIPIGYGTGEFVKLKNNWKEMCEIM